MPHKRAKRTVREQTKAGRKSDLPPSQSLLSHNDIPKSMARVLNAEAVQKAWKDRKRKLSCDLNEETRSHKKRKNADKRDDESLHSSLKIKNGESLHHFNRRVEDDLRPFIRTTMKNVTPMNRKTGKSSKREAQQSSEKARLEAKEAARDDQSNTVEYGSSRKAGRNEEHVLDFARLSTSAPKRLNDIVQAPPELTTARLKRQCSERSSLSESEDRGVISIAQKRMMEIEREKVIKRYRALKEAKLRERDVAK